VERDEFYLGYERWLPSPPKAEKPRSMFNAASLAYVGDCIYEVCFRFELCSAIVPFEQGLLLVIMIFLFFLPLLPS
jgi:hypothetical protein